MSTPPLNFTQAQYEGDPAPAAACAFCQRPLSGEYFRIANRMACENCAAQAQALVPVDTHQAFVQAVTFGIGAAIIGCLAYSLITVYFTIGYFAVGVGWLIGWAMKKGSGGLGGRRYQVIAVLLTYLSISVSVIPMALFKAAQKGYSLPHKLTTWISLLGIGLVSPVLELMNNPAFGAIGLFILFIGIRFAWRFTAGRQVDVQGPFNTAAS